MITERSLAEMVKQALKEHDPEEYERLEMDGSLVSFANLRAEAAMETHDELRRLAMDESLTSNAETMERIRRHTMKNRQAEEIAIAQATEFETVDRDASANCW